MKKRAVLIIVIILILIAAVLFAPRHFISAHTVITELSMSYRSTGGGEPEEIHINTFDADPAHDDLVGALRDIICMRSLDIHSYSVNDVEYVIHMWTQDGKYIGLGVGTDLNGRDFCVCWRGEHAPGHEYVILNYDKIDEGLEQAVSGIAAR